MELGSAAGQGLLYGLTEFLPVSSSGHVQLFQMIFGGPELPAVMIIAMRLGMLLAILLAYFKRIWAMLSHPIQSELKWMLLGAVPAVALVCLRPDETAAQMASGQYLGYWLLGTSLALLVGEWLGALRRQRRGHMAWYDGLVMGALQAVALCPGLSQSGVTISGGLAMGLKRKRAADIAFLMSFTALSCKCALDIRGLLMQTQAAQMGFWPLVGQQIGEIGGAAPMLTAAAAAMVSGFAAIKLMVVLVRRGNLKWFSAYTCLLGLAVIAWQWMQGGML